MGRYSLCRQSTKENGDCEMKTLREVQEAQSEYVEGEFKRWVKSLPEATLQFLPKNPRVKFMPPEDEV